MGASRLDELDRKSLLNLWEESERVTSRGSERHWSSVVEQAADLARQSV